jgi:uncharacterized protein YdaU (DUF1376 family)
MGKDPAFLFYSKDWIVDTAEMEPEEKGVYIDLLAHQQVNGDLPADIGKLSKIVRLDTERFTKIWNEISNKFIPNGSPGGNRLVNRKLEEVITERRDGAKKKRISGIFASLIRQSGASEEEMLYIKKQFEIELFIDLEDSDITKRLTEWFTKTSAEWLGGCLPSLGDANENGNGDGKNKEENEKSLTQRTPEEIIENRKKIFAEELKGFKDKYSTEMLNAFYRYWTELNPSRTKLRKELEKTWETKKRLVTWDNNQRVPKRNNSAKQTKRPIPVMSEELQKQKQKLLESGQYGKS